MGIGTEAKFTVIITAALHEASKVGCSVSEYIDGLGLMIEEIKADIDAASEGQKEEDDI